jgi:hypothetical protein
MNHKAIYTLYPQAVMVSESNGVFDKDGNKVEIDMAVVNAWIDPEAYKFKRTAEYPDFRDYLDGIVKGDQAQIQAYIDACLAVKAKYPKE